MLVTFGGLADPLRPDNPDFDLVGPGWLSVVTFGAMALLTGTLTAPIAGRIGAALQAPKTWWAVWMVPVSLLTVVAASESVPLALVAVLGGCLVFYPAVLVARTKPEAYRRRGRHALQVAFAVPVALALPGFVAVVSDIAT